MQPPMSRAGTGSESDVSVDFDQLLAEEGHLLSSAAPRRRRKSGKRRDPESHRRYYREKKAALATLEAEAREKLELVQELVSQQNALKTREQVLKLSIASRDEQMAVLEEMRALGLSPDPQHRASSPGPFGPPDPRPIDETPEALLVLLRDAEAALCEDSRLKGDEGGRRSQAAGGHCERKEQTRDNRHHHHQQQQQQQQQQRHDSASDSPDAPALSFASMPSLPSLPSGLSGSLSSGSFSSSGGGGARCGSQVPLSRLPLTQEQATQRYLAFMQEASKLLLQVGDNDAVSIARVERATRQLQDDMRGYAYGMTSTAARHSGTHITDSGVVGDASLWPSALARIHISEEQGDALMAAFDMHFRELEGVRSRQRDAAARLRDLLDGERSYLTISTEELLRAEMSQLAASLQKHLLAEGDVWLQLWMAMTSTLTPVAYAQILVACFPFWPDGQCIARALHERLVAERAARAAAVAPSAAAQRGAKASSGR